MEMFALTHSYLETKKSDNYRTLTDFPHFIDTPIIPGKYSIFEELIIVNILHGIRI